MFQARDEDLMIKNIFFFFFLLVLPFLVCVFSVVFVFWSLVFVLFVLCFVVVVLLLFVASLFCCCCFCCFVSLSFAFLCLFCCCCSDFLLQTSHGSRKLRLSTALFVPFSGHRQKQNLPSLCCIPGRLSGVLFSFCNAVSPSAILYAAKQFLITSTITQQQCKQFHNNLTPNCNAMLLLILSNRLFIVLWEKLV